MIKRLRTFLWKGNSASGYPKVAWDAVCRPTEEGGLGIKDILALNRALMSKHLWAVIKQDRTSLWVDWIIKLTSTGLLDKLSVVIKDGQWNWPLITDIACLEITYMLPPILKGPDRINWKSKDGSFNTSTAYDLFHPPGPKDGVPETYDHLFFSCSFSRRYFAFIRHQIPLPWPTGIGNMVLNGRHPHGVESMWLMQHFDLYWLQLSTTYGRNTMQGDSNSVVDHPRLWAGLLWRRLDRGSSVSL
ncbi:hypothetical protein Sango_3067100 [Sesamum angolense]|uniref:Reverse transcriptase zinc-binding domain-containing protein n=1 Tax=Sesamum angolense TaxID=2727404 RepID=A0AAE1T995_9LAMI|nr:hypothetical protein Sango_3067100 [Sesamum angolense]